MHTIWATTGTAKESTRRKQATHAIAAMVIHMHAEERLHVSFRMHSKHKSGQSVNDTLAVALTKAADQQLRQLACAVAPAPLRDLTVSTYVP